MRALPVVTALMLATLAVRADAPPEPRAAVWTKCSLGGRACATVDRAAGRTTVRRGSAVLWSMPVAPASLSVSEDGESLIEQYAGANLLDADGNAATTMLVFHHRTRVVRRVRLGELIGHVDALPRSVSHRVWADAFGIDAHGRYVVDTVEGRHLAYELPGARLVENRLVRR